MKILALGDVVGDFGVKNLAQRLFGLKNELSADLVIVNAENTSSGTDTRSAQLLLDSGADILTGGNHTLRRHDFFDFLNENESVIRPINLPPSAPGKGFTVIRSVMGIRIMIINVLGQVYSPVCCDNPFSAVDRLLTAQEGNYDFAVCDIHADATSEKIAFARYFNGRIKVMFGTHTHVQTADEQLLDRGSGYITDIGMCGGGGGVIGMKSECIIPRFVTGVSERFEFTDSDFLIGGALFTVDEKTFMTTDVSRVSIRA